MNELFFSEIKIEVKTFWACYFLKASLEGILGGVQKTIFVDFQQIDLIDNCLVMIYYNKLSVFAKKSKKNSETGKEVALQRCSEEKVFWKCVANLPDTW